MAVKSEQVIVQNETDKNLTHAVVVMSVNVNGAAARNIIPLFNNAEISMANPLPPNRQAERDVSNLNKRFKYARFKFIVAGGHEVATGPYTTPGQDHFIQQIRLSVRRGDGKYVQVQIEDMTPFSISADERADEFDDKA